MADRFKLRLSTLSWISLVDAPAQQTAKVLLVKRANSEEVQLNATAKVVKIAGGDNPLVYCWAFTCTDENGQPYHDLQGDQIQDDFLAAAEEYLKAGAPVDEMHHEEQTGRLAFAFPMDAAIAGAFLGNEIGDLVKTSGLMIAVRPSPEALTKVRSGEYTGVSIAGTGIRELVKAAAGNCLGCGAAYGTGDNYCASCGLKKRIAKQAVVTEEVEGHQHVLDLGDPACEWRDSYATSSQTSAGAAQPHSHAWTFDPQSGAVTVAADSGHSHTVSAVVPSDVLAAAVLNEAAERKRRAERNAQAAAEAVGSGTVAVTITAVEARAPAAGISTPAEPPPSVTSNSQESPPMDPKFAKMLATALVLPEPHRLHVAKLATDDQVAFLAMSPADQDSAVKVAEAADPEVYKTTSGLSIRKSHGPVAEQMARQADATSVELAKQAQQLEIEKAERARVQLEKRATELIPLIGKSLAERVAILKAVDAITDEATRNGAIEALKAANAAFQMLGKSIGAGDDGGPVNKTPIQAWNDGLATFAKSKNVANPLDAIGAFLKTPEGKAAKAALDTAQRMSASQPN